MLDVYKSIYKLEGQPFRLSPDYRFSFSHPSFENARTYLKYAVSVGEGCVTITGEPGTGKTTLIATLLAELNPARFQVATLTNVQLDSADLVCMTLEAFGIGVCDNDGKSSLSKLKQYLVQQFNDVRRCILIVDEAHRLPSASLEELRLIANLQQDENLLLQVFLVGQSPLTDLVQAPGLEQLHQRIIAACHLEPLVLEETIAYIEHRLCKVGWEKDPGFTTEAMDLIYKFSGGVPRVINLICHRLFMYAGINQLHNLIRGDALRVIVELHREGLLGPGVSGMRDEDIADIKKSPVNSNNKEGSTQVTG